MTVARIYVVGTDTGVGKTSLVVALVAAAARQGLRWLPFKPAQSGDPEQPDDDATRLATAAGFVAPDDIVGLRFDRPIAPGLAEDPTPFLRPSHDAHRTRVEADPILDGIALQLARLETELAPQLSLVEGAGGVHVPMPGGTWQTHWITALAPRVLVVGRAGLGTINHTLSTIDALRDAGARPIGFCLVETLPPDAANPLNPRVIACASAVPHLGTLRHGHRDVDDTVLTAVRAAIASS